MGSRPAADSRCSAAVFIWSPKPAKVITSEGDTWVACVNASTALGLLINPSTEAPTYIRAGQTTGSWLHVELAAGDVAVAVVVAAAAETGAASSAEAGAWLKPDTTAATIPRVAIPAHRRAEVRRRGCRLRAPASRRSQFE